MRRPPSSSSPRRQCLLVVSFTFVAFSVKCASAELVCTLESGVDGSTIGLGTAALNAMRFAEGQSASYIQVLDCSCGGEESAAELSDDNAAFDDIFYSSDYSGYSSSPEWRDSSVLRVHSCLELKIQLELGPSSIAGDLAGAALVIEDVGFLDVAELGAALRGAGDSGTDDTFSAFHFRNVTFGGLPSPLLFEDKTEVMFSRAEAVFGLLLHVKAHNRLRSLDPVLIFEDGFFPDKDLEAGSFKLEVINEQPAEAADYESVVCNLDYRGRVEVRDSEYGVLRSQDITISGAASVSFSSNLVGVVFPAALRIGNAKRVSVEGNYFESTAQPSRAVAEINFVKSASLEDDYAKCLEADLVVSDVTVIGVMANAMQKLDGGVAGISAAGFDEEELEELWSVAEIKDNVATLDVCKCTKEHVALDLTTRFRMKVKETSKCLTEAGAEFYTSLSDFCSDGESAPYSVSDPHRAARQSVSGTWAGYIAAAVLVTAVLTAAAVVGIVYLLIRQNMIRGFRLKF